MSGADRVGTESVDYRLPANAKQGPRRWYLAHLHFSIRFAAKTGAGHAYVSALTNGLAAAQAEFHVRGANANDRRIDWNTLGLLEGLVRHRTRSRRIEIDFYNYLQTSGVRGGRNELTFRLEQLDGASVREVHAFPDSGLIVTRRPPMDVTLTPDSRSVHVTEGDSLAIGFTVEAQRSWSERRVLVHVDSAAGLAPFGRRNQTFAHLRRPVRGRYRFQAMHAGTYEVALTALGGAHPSGTMIVVKVSGASPTGGWPIRPLLGGLLFVSGAWILVHDRRRAASFEI